MSEHSDNPPKPEVPTVPNPLSDRTADGIPVEELIRLTRELTDRITNMDRQRVAQDLKRSRRAIKTNAPITLQQFFTGEIDLDTELAKRFQQAPLMSEISMNPRRPAEVLPSRRAIAVLSTQDNGARLTFDLDITTSALEVTFTLGSMLSFRFDVGTIDEGERQRWLELARRPSGIAFLWTQERWDRDYIIFVIREHYARLYAFSPRRFEASARITPDTLNALLDWMNAFWFPEMAVKIEPPREVADYHLPGASVSGDYMVSVRDTGTLAQVEMPKVEYIESKSSTDSTDDESPPPDEQSDPSVLNW